MSAPAALPLFGDAYLADTQHLSLEEHGAYLKLMVICWRSPGCKLADDDKRLATMLGISAGRWAKLKPTVMAFWSLENGFWSQKRLSRERQFVEENRAKKSLAANERWKDKSLKNNDAGDADGHANGYAPPPPPIREEEGRESPRAREPETTLPANLSDAVPSDLSDMQKLAAECARTAGTRQIDPMQFGKDITLCREWTAAGADPPLILKTIREGVAASAKPIWSLSYFDQPIRTAAAKRKALENGTDPSPRNKPVDEVASRALARMAARRAADPERRLGLPGRTE